MGNRAVLKLHKHHPQIFGLDFMGKYPVFGVKPDRFAHKPEQQVDLVGPVCESGDFLAKDRSLPVLEAGDLLAVHAAGAYGFAMASNYNGRLRAAEVLVRDRRFAVVRERETLEDLVRESRKWLEAHVSLTTVYYRLRRREDGDRQQAIVRRLRQEDQARRDAETARKQGRQP